MSKQKKFRAKNQQKYQKLLKKAKKNPTRYDKLDYQQIVKGTKKQPPTRSITISKPPKQPNELTYEELLIRKLVKDNKVRTRPIPLPLTKKDLEELKNNPEIKASITKHFLNALGNKAIKIEYGTKKEKEEWKNRDVEQEVKEAILPFFGIEMKPLYLDDKKRYLNDRKQPKQLPEPEERKTLADANKLLSQALLTSEDFEAVDIAGFKYEDNYETVQFDTGFLVWVFNPVSSKEYELSSINGGKVNIARFEDQFVKMQHKFFDYFGSESMSRLTVTTNITFKEILANIVEVEKGDEKRVEIVGREWQVFWGQDGRGPVVDTEIKVDKEGKRVAEDYLNYDKETGVDYIKLDDDLVEDETEDRRVKK